MNSRFIYFNCKCAKCKKDFKPIGFASDQNYGEFLLRSKNGKALYMNSFDDPTFEELEKLFYNYIKTKNIAKHKSSRIFQSAYSITCDPDADGTTYHITPCPTCPFCGENDLEVWRRTNPIEYVEHDLKAVTHNHWNKLTREEKEIALAKAVDVILTKNNF